MRFSYFMICKAFTYKTEPKLDKEVGGRNISALCTITDLFAYYRYFTRFSVDFSTIGYASSWMMDSAMIKSDFAAAVELKTLLLYSRAFLGNASSTICSTSWNPAWILIANWLTSKEIVYQLL